MGALKEKILLNCAFPLADMIMGTCAMKWYKQIALMNKWTKEEVANWQTNQLKRLVNHVYSHTRYYREVMDRIGLRPMDINSLEDIKLFPILENIQMH